MGITLRVEVLFHGFPRPVTRIERIEGGDDLLQAPVDRFNPGLDITLLGYLTYSTAGASFKDKQNTEISAEEFYGELAVGDLVRVVDRRPTDGIADEVSFEREAQDGGETIHHVDTCPEEQDSTCSRIADTVIVGGREWAQTDLFRSLTWGEINAVCPAGACIDKGVLNGHDMTGWTWASTDDVNALLNFYIGSEQLGPGPGSFTDTGDDFRDLKGWRFFYSEDNPSLLGGAWRSMFPPTVEGGEAIMSGLTSTPHLSLVTMTFYFNSDDPPTTSIRTGMEYEDSDSCGWLCLFGPPSLSGCVVLPRSVDTELILTTGV